jgi:tRNA threonylcarbamoyl adenosine modification protein (Sua5/YciO/YrdC/YwlC family)
LPQSEGRIAMAQYFSIHPANPQPRLIRQAAQILRDGGVIAYPTDSCYALGCHIGDKSAMERIRAIRGIDARHHFALVCRDVGEAAVYARIDDRQYKLLRAGSIGGFAFILHATREVPRRLLHERRKTIGIRLPPHAVVQALLAELGEPLLSSSLILPGDEQPLTDTDEMRERLEHVVDLVIDAGKCGVVPSTVVDLTGPTPLITREGVGCAEVLGVTVGA